VEDRDIEPQVSAKEAELTADAAEAPSEVAEVASTASEQTSEPPRAQEPMAAEEQVASEEITWTDSSSEIAAPQAIAAEELREAEPETESIETQTSPPVAEEPSIPPVLEAPRPSPHWMDMMAPAPSADFASSPWQAEVASSTPSADPVAVPEIQNSDAREEQPVESAPESESEIIVTEDSEPQPVPEAEPVPLMTSEPERRFFAEEPAGGRGAFSYHFASEERAGREEEASAPIEPIFASDLSAGGVESPALPNEQSSSVESILPAPEEQPAAIEEEHNESSIFAPMEEIKAERMPTLPPPNREALAGIPFLLPPPVESEPPSNGFGHKDRETVDAVVQKVLQKLEPQLHSLLKPLVENLLHQELEKKEK
jgi:hypothetical protein